MTPEPEPLTHSLQGITAQGLPVEAALEFNEPLLGCVHEL